jgi:hypothetical protein
VEISGVEFAQRGEFRPGADKQLAGSVIGGFGLPQRLQVSIDTHERHAEHFAELGLSERQRARVGVCEPGEFGSAALESMCKALGLNIVDDPATRLVAQKIIELVQRGMRDAPILSAAVLSEFKGD